MDLSRLTPADAAVTLRGLERRYRLLFTGLDEDESPDDLAHRRVAGWSAAEHVAAATRSIADAQRALQAVLVDDEPRLAASDLDAGAQPHPVVPPGPVGDRLTDLGAAAVSLADRITTVPTRDWQRTGVAGDDSHRRVNALDVVRVAIDAGISHLREAGRTLEAARVAQ